MFNSNYKKFKEFRNQLAHKKPLEEGSEWINYLKIISGNNSLSPTFDISSYIAQFGTRQGISYIPPIIKEVFSEFLLDEPINEICDPWAGIGELLDSVKNYSGAIKAIACVQSENDAEIGKLLSNSIEWLVAEPLEWLTSTSQRFDAFVSIPPMGMKTPRFPITINDERIPYNHASCDYGSLLLTIASSKLKDEGCGIFVVPQFHFHNSKSIFHDFPKYGIALEAILSLPVGTLSPITNIETCIVIVRKKQIENIFVAQLSKDKLMNTKVLNNLKHNKEEGNLDLGFFIEKDDFRGFEKIRVNERIKQEQYKYGMSPIYLQDISQKINLLRRGKNSQFSEEINVIYIPLLGISEVVVSDKELRIKPHNYAQVFINPSISYARFVANYLNSEIGKAILESLKIGLTIPKLTRQNLSEIPIFIPDLPTQKRILGIDSQIISQQNVLLGLSNELGEYKRKLWNFPKLVGDVEESFSGFKSRLSNSMISKNDDSLDRWLENLPFPLASILRSWKTTGKDNYEKKSDYLLLFFEATIEFLSIILLSAFSSNNEIFLDLKPRFLNGLKKDGLRIASFGTWKVVIEYFAKQTRILLSGKSTDIELCKELFANPSLKLPEMLCNEDLFHIFNKTNKYRNDWKGHCGVASNEIYKVQNDLLVTELQKLREVMGDVWGETQLVRALNSRAYRSKIDNDIYILTGSNSVFNQETRSLKESLFIDSLYLLGNENKYALKILPFIEFGSSPETIKNACYFYNRVEDGNLRYISYHYESNPIFTKHLDDSSELIELLS